MLTLALALATLVLSLIFRGRTLSDPRRASLQRYAWLWTLENLLLAVAVYNRLLIYVGYNGMTMMRMIGFFGITVVVVGVLLVVIKIGSDRSFWWLLRAQSVALALGIAIYSITPVDYIVHRYNVSRILAGDLRPAVMIAVKPIDDEGYFPLLQWMSIDDAIIREGVLAMLAKRQTEIESFADDQPWHWTRYQADKYVLYVQSYRLTKSNGVSIGKTRICRQRSCRHFSLMPCSGIDDNTASALGSPRCFSSDPPQGGRAV